MRDNKSKLIVCNYNIFNISNHHKKVIFKILGVNKIQMKKIFNA